MVIAAPPRRFTLRPIVEVAEEAGLDPSDLFLFGPYKAKVRLNALARLRVAPEGRVVLVTSINPTPAGEGKTVTAIGLAGALRALGSRAGVCLRQPSMGPVFGLKGGATGGGRATVEPAQDINLHFTGDLHAVAAAHNLLAAMLDEHIYRGRDPQIDVRRAVFPRVLDVNDRALRRIVVGLNGGVPREEAFEITAASEVMSVVGLAGGFVDLRRRLGRVIAAVTRSGQPVTAEDLRTAGAMAALLREAIIPNLVQTQEGCPAFVHTGPFANIAHGTSSVVSLQLARKLFEHVVIEAGFGADLGAEKFMDIVGTQWGMCPETAVIVVTTRALKHHAGVQADRLVEPDAEAVRAGLGQLRHHTGIVRRFGMRPVICLNAFSTDSRLEHDVILEAAASLGAMAAISQAYEQGAEGAMALAEHVREPLPPGGTLPAPLYTADLSLEEKMRIVSREIYGAVEITFSDTARRHLEQAEAWGFAKLPVCVAKTQYSLSDDPTLRGVPRNFPIHIRDVAVRAGAGFVLALAGEIMTMPGLPARPRAWGIDLDGQGEIVGVQP